MEGQGLHVVPAEPDYLHFKHCEDSFACGLQKVSIIFVNMNRKTLVMYTHRHSMCRVGCSRIRPVYFYLFIYLCIYNPQQKYPRATHTVSTATKVKCRFVSQLGPRSALERIYNKSNWCLLFLRKSDGIHCPPHIRGAAASPAMFKKLLKTHFLTQHFPLASFQPADFYDTVMQLCSTSSWMEVTTIGWFRHRWAQFSEVCWCSLMQTLVHQDTHFVFNLILCWNDSQCSRSRTSVVMWSNFRPTDELWSQTKN